jgi:hypothetical protein
MTKATKLIKGSRIAAEVAKTLISNDIVPLRPYKKTLGL